MNSAKMNLARMLVAGVMLAAVPSMASAQQTQKGTITTLDRLNGTITISQKQSGTVGAGGGGATEQQYKAPEASLGSLHAGDKVNFSVGEIGGKQTVTKIEAE
jgi:Cu/Ag efflux protein CusF